MPEVLLGWVCVPAFSVVGQHLLVLPRGVPRPSLHRAEPNQRLCLALSCGLPLLGDCAHHLDHHLPDLPAPLGCPWGLPLLYYTLGHSLTTSAQTGDLLSSQDGLLCFKFTLKPQRHVPITCHLC